MNGLSGADCIFIHETIARFFPQVKGRNLEIQHILILYFGLMLFGDWFIPIVRSVEFINIFGEILGEFAAFGGFG